VTGTTAVLLVNSLGTGGAERAVLAAARELGKRQRDVRILCLERSPGEPPMPTLSLSRMRASANAVLKLAALPFLAFRLARYVARENAGAVMSHLFRANFVNVLAKLLTGSRHRAILVNHTRVSRLLSEGLQGRINWMLCRWLYPRADLVASVSRGAAEETARLMRLAAGRVGILYDPIDTSAASVARAGAQAVEAVVCVGRLVALKRFRDVITAFARIAPDYAGLQLRIVGDGPEKPSLQGLCEKLEVTPRVTFLGTVAEPAGAVAGCSCFVSSSETEGFGMAIVESLAAGVPVIASDCAYGPREILCPASDPSILLEPGADMEAAQYGVLYPVGSVSTLEKALRRVLSDDSLRAELSRRGPQRAADFSVERSSVEYERLFFPA